MEDDKISNYENDEYKIWKKNSPYFYDMCISHILEWPSLTCQFLPYYEEDSEFKRFKLLLGTFTSDNYPNYLIIAKLKIPSNKYLEDWKKDFQIIPNNDNEKNQKMNCLEIETRICHNGEVNKARYMPQHYNIIATKENSGNINIFNYATRPTIPKEKEPVCNPDLVLHTDEEDYSFGLNWSPLKEGIIVSSGVNSNIKIWDINEKQSNPSHLYSMRTCVNDIIFHKFHKEILLSCNEEGSVNFYDMRTKKSFLNLIASDSELYSLETSPFNEYLFLTGSSNGKVSLFDMRYLKEEVKGYEYHTNGINKLEFSPFKENVFSSCSQDKKIGIWDISKFEEKDKMIEENNIPNELILSHEGHRGIISDFSWNMNEEWLCISTEEENNTLQIWKLAEELYYL